MLGRIAGIYVPAYLKKRELKNLFEITGSAFGVEVPSLADLSYPEYLIEFARFTKRIVERSIDNLHNLGIARQQLCHRSYEIGSAFRKKLGVSSMTDVMEACRIIYNCLGIDFRGTDQGEITISNCIFSNYYSEQICGVISCLDKGLVAGLSGGGKLSYTQRITEGMDCCKAELVPQEKDIENSNRGGYRCWWCNCC